MADRRTVMCFAGLAGVTSSRALLGPVVTSLVNHEGHRSDSVAAVLAFCAVGVVLNGLLGPLLAAWVALSRLLLGSLCGCLGGLTLLLAGLRLAFVGAFLLGFFGSVVIMSCQVVLVDVHGSQLPKVLGQTGFFAGLLAAGAPAIFGTLADRGRLALGAAGVLPAVALMAALLAATGPRNAIDGAQARETAVPVQASGMRGLPAAARLGLIALFCFSAVEWSVIFWGAQAVHDFPGVSIKLASAVVSAFLVTNLMSKLAWAHVSAHQSLAQTSWAAAALFVGILSVWAMVAWTATAGGSPARRTAFCVLTAGLALGLAGCAQLATSMALSVPAPLRARSASRISLMTGASVLVLPSIMGVTLAHAPMPVSSTLLWLLGVMGVIPLIRGRGQSVSR